MSKEYKESSGIGCVAYLLGLILCAMFFVSFQLLDSVRDLQRRIAILEQKK